MTAGASEGAAASSPPPPDASTMLLSCGNRSALGEPQNAIDGVDVDAPRHRSHERVERRVIDRMGAAVEGVEQVEPASAQARDQADLPPNRVGRILGRRRDRRHEVRRERSEPRMVTKLIAASGVRRCCRSVRTRVARASPSWRPERSAAPRRQQPTRDAIAAGRSALSPLAARTSGNSGA